MQDLLTFLNQVDPPISEEDKANIGKNLLLILKDNYGTIRKFKFTKQNYRLLYDGDVEDKKVAFWAEIMRVSKQEPDRFPREMCEVFFAYWAEKTQKGKTLCMKKDLEKTWETKGRMIYWQSNKHRNGY